MQSVLRPACTRLRRRAPFVQPQRLNARTHSRFPSTIEGLGRARCLLMASTRIGVGGPLETPHDRHEALDSGRRPPISPRMQTQDSITPLNPYCSTSLFTSPTSDESLPRSTSRYPLSSPLLAPNLELLTSPADDQLGHDFHTIATQAIATAVCMTSRSRAEQRSTARHGKADQEPLGETDSPDRGSMYESLPLRPLRPLRPLSTVSCSTALLTARVHRSRRRRAPGLLLAQVLLRLPHQEPRRRRQARPHSPDRESRHSPDLVRVRVAAEMGCWLEDSVEHGRAPAVAAARQPERRVALSGDERGALLSDCDRGILLGI